MSAIDLFKKSEAVLEYSPVHQGDGVWKWYWTVLALPLEDESVASGEADSKAQASLAARRQAHKAHRRITTVRCRHHSLENSGCLQ